MTATPRALTVASLLGAALIAGGCSNVVTRVNPEQVAGGKTATVVVKLATRDLAADEQPTLAITDGEECGTVTATADKKENGKWAAGTFTAAAGVENCAVTILSSVGDQSATTRAVVNRFDPRVRIDGFSAIAAILIASFAIDRVTTGLLSLVAFVRRRKPGLFPARARGAADFFAEERDQRVPYFIVAGAIGSVVLGWFGEVRVLAALGFNAVSPYLDAVITGLVLMIGADRAADLLKKLDVPVEGAVTKKSAAPIEVTGRLVLENPEAKASDRMMV